MPGRRRRPSTSRSTTSAAPTMFITRSVQYDTRVFVFFEVGGVGVVFFSCRSLCTAFVLCYIAINTAVRESEGRGSLCSYGGSIRPSLLKADVLAKHPT